MNFTCPVCGFDQMDAPPQNYEICSSCGTEFGNDDLIQTYTQLRLQWLNQGAPWFFGEPPIGWNPYWQLIQAGLLLPDAMGHVLIQAAPKQETVEKFIGDRTFDLVAA